MKDKEAFAQAAHNSGQVSPPDIGKLFMTMHEMEWFKVGLSFASSSNQQSQMAAEALPGKVM